MSLTETTLGQEIDAPALEPAPANWLPLTAGDQVALTREAVAEHGWPASIFIFLSYLTAVGLGVGAAGAALTGIVALVSADWPFAGFLLLATAGLSLGVVLQYSLAQHVRHFSRWGWYGVMVELACITLAKVNLLLTEPDAAAGGMAGIVIVLLWMAYFWKRRADFDVDVGL
jgi:hypothetical protein